MFSYASVCAQGGVHGEGVVCGEGGGHAWQKGGACVAGETVTAADVTYPPGMHSCPIITSNQLNFYRIPIFVKQTIVFFVINIVLKPILRDLHYIYSSDHYTIIAND